MPQWLHAGGQCGWQRSQGRQWFCRQHAPHHPPKISVIDEPSGGQQRCRDMLQPALWLLTRSMTRSTLRSAFKSIVSGLV